MAIGQALIRNAIGLLLLFVFVGCGEALPKPAKVSFNGYTVDAQEGSASFRFSALSAEGNVISSGSVSNPSVSNLTLVQGSGNLQGSATICGQFTTTPGPISCVITLDSTGSMSGNDPNRQRAQAAKAFVNRLRSGDVAAVASFDTSTSPTPGFSALRIRQDFTSDKTALLSAVDQATFEGGGTNLWDATYDSARHVSSQQGNRIVLVLTDGEDNSSSKTPAAVIQQATQSQTRVYMVGLSSDPNSLSFRDMQRIAANTGGLFAFAGNANQLETMFNSIFNDIQGSFCIKVVFQVNGSPPPAGTAISGTLRFAVNGASFQQDFTVYF
ncbi:vWA domain-containing protein [Meiothermus taiwanensis]|uniref:VWFA-related Acidobacterial domain protein n=2 Tax=Meiothermus taiwanensis TaxID=172827 RepID=A0A399E0E4_9DEIN|nr:VWA domain-containing protein [Meiothermus taiwanensis]AWR87983.1 von Willebrand factor type A [Meiothermus taiwanensis WR-220]RIH76983.1 VWFA-related Acidobacterial domain protein [Meiothermus taiwanensis]